MTIKRLFDIIGAGLALILLSPVLGVVALQVRRKLGSPVLFRQVRPGRDGRPFEMVKFRSMSDARDANGDLLPDDVRLGTFGAWLRRSSLDELPELLNVLKGDMSLVGPRPLLMEYLPLYSARQRRRMEVRPGITGLAQVRGRNALSWDDKFEWDVQYVETRSFWLDLRILFETVAIVFSGRGVATEGMATTEKFRGSGQGDQT